MLSFLLLSDSKHNGIIDFLNERGSVSWSNSKPSLDVFLKHDWIISYGYRHLINQQIIDKIKNPIINLHISYLPFNRGAYPNYWSFKENTPKGVSIHFIDTGIDTGPILIQKKIIFGKTETLESSYQKLKIEIENLFYNSFEKMINNEIEARPQIGKGTFHLKSSLPKEINWKTNINEI